jgi:hypothetical protein
MQAQAFSQHRVSNWDNRQEFFFLLIAVVEPVQTVQNSRGGDEHNRLSQDIPILSSES